MIEYTLIDDDGNIIGTTSIEDKNTISVPLKPLRECDSAKWNGDKWMYSFKKNEEEIIEEMKYDKDFYEKVFLLINRYIINIIRPLSSGKAWKKKESEKISVLIPCYGKADYIREAVKSCIFQTIIPDEIHILLMDDKSISLKENLEKISNTVHCHVSEKMNAVRARKELVTFTDAEWIIFLDGDDELDLSFIEKTIKHECAICFPAISVNNELKFHDMYSTYSLNNIMRLNLTSLMRKEVFLDYSLDEDLTLGGEDIDFILKILEDKKYLAVYEPETFYKWRQNVEGQLTSGSAFIETWIKAVSKHRNFFIEELDNVPCNPDAIIGKSIANNLYAEKYDNIFSMNDKSCDCMKSGAELQKISDKIKKYIGKLANDSMERDTSYVYNKEEYIVFGDVPENAEEIARGKTFDALIFRKKEIPLINVNKNSGFILRKDIYNEIIDSKLTGIDIDIFLLKKYSCFVFENFYSEETIETGNEFVNNVQMKRLIPNKISGNVELEILTTKGPFQKVTFILDKTCNKTCEYCRFQNATKKFTDEEIFNNFDKCLSYVERLCNGRVFPHIMGGEPSIWSDWLTKKVCERLSKYRFNILFTNGSNRNSFFFKQPNFNFFTHITDWEGTDVTKYKPTNGEFMNICIEHNKVQEACKFFEPDVPKWKFYMQLCQHPNSEWQITTDDILKLNNEVHGTSSGVVQQAADLIERGGIELFRKTCASNGIWNIDCLNMTISPCCGTKNFVSFENFKPNMAKNCEGCLDVGNLGV